MKLRHPQSRPDHRTDPTERPPSVSSRTHEAVADAPKTFAADRTDRLQNLVDERNGVVTLSVAPDAADGTAEPY